LKQLRKRLTYANVMSTLSVFLILGGATAFAASKIGTKDIQANAVTSGKIAKEAVVAGKIKANAVTSAKVANGAITSSKLGAGSVLNAALGEGAVSNAKIGNDAVTTPKIGGAAVTTEKINTAAVTTGKIASGAVTGAQFGKTSFVLGSQVSAAANSTSNVELECDAGQRLLSGGVFNSDKDLVLLGSYPNTASKWKMVVSNTSASAINWRPMVLCLE